MKTKNIILLASCLLLFVVVAPAQSYYYDKTKTFNENGYAYQCDNVGGIVTLYNKQNRFTYAEKTYKDGSALPEDIYEGRVSMTMFIDPNTGKVIEVKFVTWIRSPYARISPSTYYKIEQQLKKEIWFTMTEVGKQLNFGYLNWEHEVE
jgi:hypothetical protein